MIIPQLNNVLNDLSNPHSYYWQCAAIDNLIALKKLLKDNAPIWRRLTFPAQTFEDYSWKEVAFMVEAAFDALVSGETDLRNLAVAAWASIPAAHVCDEPYPYSNFKPSADY